MAEVLLVLASFALNVALPYWIVRFDMQRLSDERLARAWNDASFWCAVFAFGPLALPVHFAKTRRSLGGVVLGVALAAAAVGVEVLIVGGGAAIFGIG